MPGNGFSSFQKSQGDGGSQDIFSRFRSGFYPQGKGPGRIVDLLEDFPGCCLRLFFPGQTGQEQVPEFHQVRAQGPQHGGSGQPPFGTDLLEPQGHFFSLVPGKSPADPFRPGQFQEPLHFPAAFLPLYLDQGHRPGAGLDGQQMPGPGSQMPSDPLPGPGQPVPALCPVQFQDSQEAEQFRHPACIHGAQESPAPQQQSRSKEKRSQGDLHGHVFLPPAVGLEPQESHGQEGHAHGQEKAPESQDRSQPQAHHRSQFGISRSHALRDLPVDQGQQRPQDGRTCHRPQEIPIRQSMEDQEQQSQRREKIFIQLEFVHVQPGNHQHQGQAEQPYGQYRRRAGHPGHQDKKGPAGSLPPEQGTGQFRSAVTAASLLGQPAHQGDQFQRTQHRTAAVTVGTGTKNGFLPPDPLGPQIQEAAQAAAHDAPEQSGEV